MNRDNSCERKHVGACRSCVACAIQWPQLSEVRMFTINTSASVQVADGPSFSTSSKFDMEAYDRLDVRVKPGVTLIDLQPGAATQIRVFGIKASVYDESANLDKLFYVLSAAQKDSSPVPLDAPQLYVGAGAMRLFNVDKPTTVKLTNNLTPAAEVRIEIVVGRLAASAAPTQ